MDKIILLDANLLIAALDTRNLEAMIQLDALLNDDDVALAISSLIRYEVLRGVDFSDNEKYERLNNLLNDYQEFEINNKIAMLSADLFRFARSKKEEGKNSIVDKRSFDVFHLATAKCNELELCSNDGDLGKLENLYQDYQKWLSSNENETPDY